MANHRLFTASYELNRGAGTSNAKKVWLKYDADHERGNLAVDKLPALCVGIVGRHATEAATTTASMGVDLVKVGEAILGIPDIVESWAYKDYPRDSSDGRRRKNYKLPVGTTSGTNQLPSEAFRFQRVYMVGVLIFGAEIPVLIGTGAYAGVNVNEPVVGALGGPVGSGTSSDDQTVTVGAANGQPGYVQGRTAYANTASIANNKAILTQVMGARVIVSRKVSAAESGTRDGVAYLTLG